jgi:hypothetical protein
MRTITLEEVETVYGAGGKGRRSCGNPRGGRGSGSGGRGSGSGGRGSGSGGRGKRGKRGNGSS